MTDWDLPFNGCKCALFMGDRLVILLRDDNPEIPFPNMWDLPGGGREGSEDPFQTLAREVKEELGLDLRQQHIQWHHRFPANHTPGAFVWYFVAEMPEEAVGDIEFGNEGQGWKLVTIERFMALENAVPGMAERLSVWRDNI